MSEEEVTREFTARGWSVYTDPGFVAHAGPFFNRFDGEGPRFCLPVLPKHQNRNGSLQGGALMTFIDRALGATARHLTDTANTVTVTLTTQFVDSVKIGETVEVAPTMVRATKRLVFMSGVFMVDSRVVAVANGVWSKIVRAPA